MLMNPYITINTCKMAIKAITIKLSFIAKRCKKVQPVQSFGSCTGQLYNYYIQQLYILGHKEFACKPIYDISINGLVIYITRIQENP